MPEKSAVFEKHYEDYLKRIADIDTSRLPEILGVGLSSEGIRVDWFGQPHVVSPAGIMGPDGRRPNYSTCVILCKYLLMCPEQHILGDAWLSYKDFKDAAPLIAFFSNSVEGRIAHHFSDRINELVAATGRLGGRPPVDTDLPYDLCARLDPLPQVPCLLAFNGADEEFGADCRILFEQRAEAYLDMECVAMIGSELADRLVAEGSV